MAPFRANSSYVVPFFQVQLSHCELSLQASGKSSGNIIRSTSIKNGTVNNRSKLIFK